MNPCPEAVDYLYERYYNRGRTAAGQRLLEICWRWCSRFADSEGYLSS